MFIDLKKYLPSGSINGKATICLKGGSTLEDLLKTLDIPANEPRIIVINGISQGVSTKVSEHILQEGDVVSIFPPVAGG